MGRSEPLGCAIVGAGFTFIIVILVNILVYGLIGLVITHFVWGWP